MLPNIVSATEYRPGRIYVTLKLIEFPVVLATSYINNDVFNTGDIMISVPGISFVATSRDMEVLTNV